MGKNFYSQILTLIFVLLACLLSVSEATYIKAAMYQIGPVNGNAADALNPNEAYQALEGHIATFSTIENPIPELNNGQIKKWLRE